MNKFYVGAEHIGAAFGRGRNASIVRASVEEAVEDARKVLWDNPHRDCVVIVEIIRVVRRSTPPIIVEEV